MENETLHVADSMRSHIEQQERSGMTASFYCAEQGLKRSTFYYWKKKLSPSQNSNFVSLGSLRLSGRATVTFLNGVSVCFEEMPSADYLKYLIG